MVRKTYKYSMLGLFTTTLAILITLVAPAAYPSMAGGPVVGKSFVSPQQAVASLVAAVQDNNDAELLAIFGPDSEGLISSGDKIADQKGKALFLKS